MSDEISKAAQHMAKRIETAEDLEQIVAEQTAIITEQAKTVKNLGALVKDMDGRIKILTELLDHHHELFIRHGWAKPRDRNVN
jgi:uncharacterized coiled-coil protein SlyX